MSNPLTDTPEFVEGFVKYCFDKGFNEEQTSKLLRVAALNELAESGDKDFHEGLRLGSNPKYEKLATVKSAGFMKGLKSLFGMRNAKPIFPHPPRMPGGSTPHIPVPGGGGGVPPIVPPTMGPPPIVPRTHYNVKLPIGASHSLLTGAGSAAAGGVGGAMFGDPDNGLMSNVMGGAMLGAGLRTAAGPMFRGGNFRKFVSGMNPFEAIPAAAGASKGTFGVNLLKPIETMGKALTTKGVPTALATGAGYGALAGAGYTAGANIANGGATDTSQFLPY